MDAQILLIIGAVIVVGALVVVWQQRRGVVKRPSATHNPELSSTNFTDQLSRENTSLLSNDWGDGVGLSQEQVAQINAEIVAGRKINAIKLYREFTGIGLKEAKETVEDMMRGKKPKEKKGAWPFEPEDDGAMVKIQQALRAGNKIEAIKLYRESTGMGLKEAKDAVDAMERGQMPSARQFGGDVMAQVEQELRAKRKINAIKLYREAHNVGLKEAKDAVDAVERNLGM